MKTPAILVNMKSRHISQIIGLLSDTNSKQTMLWTRYLMPENTGFLLDEDYEDSPAHAELSERLRKTLYYGKPPSTERHSLPVTEFAVEFFQDAAPRELGRLDTFLAAGFSRQACMSPSSLMLSMIYIERLKHKNPEYLQQVSSADLFLISMMVASKYLYDEGIDEEVFNDEWAQSGGIDIDDINELERNFLNAIDWDLFVRAEHWWNTLFSVERELALRKGWEHMFYTYTEAWILSDKYTCAALISVLQTITQVALVCSVAYIGCVLSMVGALSSLQCIQRNTPSTAALLTTTASLDLPDLPVPNVADVISRLPEISSSSPDLVSVELPPELSSQLSHSKKLRTNGLANILTLTLIKDTFLQFVSGVQDKLSSEASQKFSYGDRIFPVCSCGACPYAMDTTCWNQTTLTDLSWSNIPAKSCERKNSPSLWNQHSVCKQETISDLCEGKSFRCCCPKVGLAWKSDNILQPPAYDIIHSFSTNTFIT